MLVKKIVFKGSEVFIFVSFKIEFLLSGIGSRKVLGIMPVLPIM